MNVDFYDSLLADLIGALKAKPAVTDSSLPSLWLELGREIAEDPGPICEQVREQVQDLVDDLPLVVVDYVWWCTEEGEDLSCDIETLAQNDMQELRKLETPDSVSVLNAVAAYLLEWVYEWAEDDYDLYEDGQMMDNEEEEAE